nr:tubulin-specific chaperone e [Quercus suber]
MLARSQTKPVNGWASSGMTLLEADMMAPTAASSTSNVGVEPLLSPSHHRTTDSETHDVGRNKSATAASFLRPGQPWDVPRTFFQAVEEKYLRPGDRQQDEIIYVSGKQAEEVGFEKFARRQAQLRGIYVLVLEGMRIQHRCSEAEADRIAKVCGHVTDLDLSANLFETFHELAHLCKSFPKLRTLTLDGNRFLMSDEGATLPSVRSLGLSNTLMTCSEISELSTRHFVNLSTLVIKENALSDIRSMSIPDSVETLDLTGNQLGCLNHTWLTAGAPSLRTVLLKHNRVSSVLAQDAITHDVDIEDLDLSHNSIDGWAFFNALLRWAPKLKHLRVTGNPLYQDLKTADGKDLATEDGYMLTIARLPALQTLNYSTITDKERLNAETYYLGQIAGELARHPVEQEAEVLSAHPRYVALCEEYGAPTISRQHQGSDAVDPDSLAYRLARIHFVCPSESRRWQEEIPKSFNIYAILGLAGERLGVSPLRLRLVWQTGERDPRAVDHGAGAPEPWDSSDEEDADDGGDAGGEAPGLNGAGWTEREVDLVAGTSVLGSYVEGQEATIRVEVVDAMP